MGIEIIISHIAILAPADNISQFTDRVQIRFRLKQEFPFRRSQPLAGFNFFTNTI